MSYTQLSSTARVKILILKFGALGDIVMSIAAIKAVKEKFPLATITVVVDDSYSELFESCPIVDNVVPFYVVKVKKYFTFFEIANELRQYCFDMIIDLKNSRKSHLLTYLLRVKKTYGTSNNLGFFLSKKVKRDRTLRPTERLFAILKLLNIEYDKTKHKPQLCSSPENLIAIGKRLQELSVTPIRKRNVIGVCIAASKPWKTKNWPIDQLIQFIKILKENDTTIVLFGQDVQVEQALLSNFSEKNKIISLVNNTSLSELVSLISVCDAIVTPDTGPMHIASAVNTPCVALFGPTSPQKYAPECGRLSYFYTDIACSPCHKKTCKRKDYHCMVSIEPHMVAKQLFSLIEKTEDKTFYQVSKLQEEVAPVLGKRTIVSGW